MRNNPLHQYLNDNPLWDLFYRLVLWMTIGLTTSLILLHGESGEEIARYADTFGKTSVRNFDRLGVLGILITSTALLFKNLERTGKDSWGATKVSCKIGYIVRRTANDVLISAFGLGATILGVLLSLAILLEGSRGEWLIFGATAAKFIIVVSAIGAINLVTRADNKSKLLLWQQYITPKKAALIYPAATIAIILMIIK